MTAARAPLTAALEAGVLTLTLDRAEKRNALSAAMIEALHRELERADLDAGVRVVLLRGAGKDFCAGADLGELLASADQEFGANEAAALRLGLVFERIRALPKPVIAMVQGRALAGGAGLATACDLVVAGKGAQFGYPEIERGFVPAMVMTILRRLTGEKRAFDLVATGRVVTAAEALDLGLVSRVVPDTKLGGEGVALARTLAERSATALALTKRLFYEQDATGFREGIALGARVNALSRATPDFRAAIAAFLKK